MKNDRYRATVHAVGIKKRARTRKQHRFPLGYLEFSGSAEKLARTFAPVKARQEMRTIEKLWVTLELVQVEYSNPNFPEIEHWSPFDERTKAARREFEIDINQDSKGVVNG